MRTREDEQQYVERCEKDATEDLLYLLDHGHDDRVNRVLDILKARAERHREALEIAKHKLHEIREELLAEINRHDQDDQVL